MPGPRWGRGGALPFALAWACSGCSLGGASFVCTYLATRGTVLPYSTRALLQGNVLVEGNAIEQPDLKIVSPTPPAPYVPPYRPVVRIRWGKDRLCVLDRHYAGTA